MVLTATCLACGDVHEIKMQRADWAKWRSGVLIQNAAPYLAESEREMLISDVCGDCFDDMFLEDK